MSWRIVWKGDLEDDCTARVHCNLCGREYVLRAEAMDDKVWWYAVSVNDEDVRIADETMEMRGETARMKAKNAYITHHVLNCKVKRE